MTAIFAGTFDPFTLGHKDIVRRALSVFDSVIVAVAEETGKHTASVAERVEIARLSVSDFDSVRVCAFDGLLTDFAAKTGDCVLVRGVRGSVDLEYEKQLCRVYGSLSGVDAVHFICAPQYEHISSTATRELAALGSPIDGFVDGKTIELVKRVYGR